VCGGNRQFTAILHGKLNLKPVVKAQRGVHAELYSLLNVGALWRWSMSCSSRFSPGQETRYPFYRRLGGPQVQVRWVRKIPPSHGIDPLTVQPVASLKYIIIIIVFVEYNKFNISCNVH
jgi:hypothetical protein